MIVIKRSESELTKEDTLGQKRCVFQTLPKTSQRLRRANTQGKFVPERKCTNAENSSSGLSPALLSR